MRIPVSPVLIGESGQHGVSGNHAVPAQVLGGIMGLIRLPKKPVGTNIAAGNVRRHADAQRYLRPGSSRAMSYLESSATALLGEPARPHLPRTARDAG